jgi:hypothetical protein
VLAYRLKRYYIFPLNLKERLMQYMLLIYDAENNWMDVPQEKLQKLYADYGAVTKEMVGAGVMRGGSELQPIATATTVRVRNGKALTTDGPFAETKEQLGGYYLIEVANLDEALKWAAKIPSAVNGSIEVRPLTPNQG